MRGSVQVSAGQGGVLASTNKSTECWMGFEWAGTEESQGSPTQAVCTLLFWALGHFGCSFCIKEDSCSPVGDVLTEAWPISRRHVTCDSNKAPVSLGRQAIVIPMLSLMWKVTTLSLKIVNMPVR